MASVLSKLAPAIIWLRGSKRSFSSADRTLAKVARARAKPVSFAPPKRGFAGITISQRDDAGWPVFDVTPVGADHGRRAVYLHGGVYSFEIDPLHWRLVAELARAARIRITVPIMPLAPEGTASAVVPHVADLVEALIAEVGAERVAVLGDSSGGGMALATAMVLRDRGLHAIGRVILISPWLDISGTDPRLAEIAPSDPWLAVPGTHAAGALYRAELAEDDPLVSPIHGDLSGLGPVTLVSGTRDILNADAVRFVSKAAAVGHAVSYHEGEGMIHNYAILPMPEGAAMRRILARDLLL